MQYLFIVAMEKEAKEIIKYYNLNKLDDNYYKNNDISLVITGVSRNGITSSLINLLYKYNLNYKDFIMINIGMCGTNNLKVGEVVQVDKSFGYHFDLTPFDEPLYHSVLSPFKMDKTENIKSIDCYTSDGFVLNTCIKQDAIFDMELNAIVNFPFKKYYSIKIISDSLDNNQYEKFNYNDSLKKVYDIINKIISENNQPH